MIFVDFGNILETKVDAIVCVMNGTGIVNKGTPRRILDAAGKNVELEIKSKYQNDKKSFSVGSCFETSSGDLFEKGIKRICYTIITSSPGSLCSVFDMSNAFEKLLKMAIKNERKSLSIPGIGIEEECIDIETAAISMSKIIRNYCDKIEIHVIDANKAFIGKMKKYIL